MNDDDARDLRAALGGLLVDEPPARWTVRDDVARGRAYQRRRRTQWGAGIGLVAALALVLGVLGPLRPDRVPDAPLAWQPPTVQGVDGTWLTSLSRSFTEMNATAVDWERSSVVRASDGGFALDLALVQVSVTTEAEGMVVDYPDEPGPVVARAAVTWSSGSAPGPVVATCAEPECVRRETSVFPAWTDEAGEWRSGGAQPSGTRVIARTYDEGGTLELSSVPVEAATASMAALDFAGLQLILERIGPPPAAPGVAGPDLEGAVTAALRDLGWTSDGVARVTTEPGSPAVRSWTVHRSDGDPQVQAKLVLRTWDARSFAAGAAPQGRVLIACSGDRACGMVDVIQTDCTGSSPCWSSSSTVVQREYDGLPIGTAIAASWSLSPRAAAEIAATPVRGTGTSPDPLETDAFLTQEARGQVLDVVQQVLLAQAPQIPAPQAQPCDAADVELRPAAAADDPTAPNQVRIVINAVPRSADVTCVLDGVPTVEALSPSGAPLSFDVSEDPSRQAQQIGGTTDAAFEVYYPVCAEVGGEVATLRVTLTGDEAATDVDVSRLQPIVSCAVGVAPGTTMTVTGFLPAEVDEPVAVTACSPGEVKLIPATGQPSEATGSRGLWIEIHARNPEVDCLATAPTSVSFSDADGAALAFLSRAGIYQGTDFDTVGLEVTQAGGPARFALTKYRCDEAPATAAATAYVTLEGWSRPVAVELPPGSGIERCPGDQQAAGNTIYLSRLDGGFGVGQGG